MTRPHFRCVTFTSSTQAGCVAWWPRWWLSQRSTPSSAMTGWGHAVAASGGGDCGGGSGGDNGGCDGLMMICHDGGGGHLLDGGWWWIGVMQLSPCQNLFIVFFFWCTAFFSLVHWQRFQETQNYWINVVLMLFLFMLVNFAISDTLSLPHTASHSSLPSPPAPRPLPLSLLSLIFIQLDS